MNKKVKKIIFSLLRIIVMLMIIFFFFSAGAYLAVESDTVKKLAEKEVLYLGKLKGKYSKVDGQWAQNIDFNMYWDVWEKLRSQHPNRDQVTDKQMFYGSLKGLVASFADPYTEFMNPKENKDFEEDMSGSFDGIGAEIGIRDGLLTIISPLDGSPASRAGLIPGDKILEINSESTKELSLDQAVAKIRGPKGTEVILSIYNPIADEIREVKIIRDTITVKSVEYKKLENDVFLIKISSFNDDTSELFAEAVKNFVASASKKLILDLRSNPGGYLEVAVEVLGEWINGEVAVIEEFADGARLDYPARGLNRLANYPTLVLINSGSASASEIIAGALRDHKKAYIIGETSYGKGSVQILGNLKDGSALKMTVAKWLTPKGQDINEEGIKADMEIEISYEEYLQDKDPQMDAAKKFFDSEEAQKFFNLNTINSK